MSYINRKNNPTYMTVIPFLYIPRTRPFKSNKGLSEKRLKRRLEKQGWMTWKTSAINITREAEIYPNVKKKYEKLNYLLEKHHPNTLEYLQYIAAVHHGLPDFICFKGYFKFVECKRNHEPLSNRQKICIEKLRKLGFVVEVHKLVEAPTKTRLALINIHTNEKDIREKQLTITKLYKR